MTHEYCTTPIVRPSNPVSTTSHIIRSMSPNIRMVPQYKNRSKFTIDRESLVKVISHNKIFNKVLSNYKDNLDYSCRLAVNEFYYDILDIDFALAKYLDAYSVISIIIRDRITGDKLMYYTESVLERTNDAKISINNGQCSRITVEDCNMLENYLKYVTNKLGLC